MRYAFIRDEAKNHGVEILCELLEVSRSGYYAFAQRKPSQRSEEHERLGKKIQKIFTESRKTYGYRRVVAALKKASENCGKYRVSKLMKKLNLMPYRKRKFKLTTNSKHDYPIVSNVLNREFNPIKPNQAWTADITYVETTDGWLYLASMMDLYGRKIIGWAMDKTMTSNLVISALQMALSRREIGEGLILHSDRGKQYAATDYQLLLKQNRIICSMSRKGNCWDNAPMESFFRTLKVEALYGQRLLNREETKLMIFEYIEVFYNRQRQHSVLNYLSPEEYELAHVNL